MDLIVLRALVSMGLLGALLAAGLAFASKRFAVEVDPRIEKIEEVLPGANCGACGFPGCSNFAGAVVEGIAPMNGCAVGGTQVAEELSIIMGINLDEGVVPMKALLHCGGSCDKAKDRAYYQGIPDCKAANLLGGGVKKCVFGCLGLGTCQRACPFGAISMGQNGLPIVDWAKCTGCGICASKCPKGLFKMVPANSQVHVRCLSTDKGAEVRKVCSAGCVGCKRCEKACETDAIVVNDFLATIDYNKCINCGKCAEVCPTGTINAVKIGRVSPDDVDDTTQKVI